MDFSVPETFLSGLKLGKSIEAISPAYREHVFFGTVTSLRSRIDPVTRAATVRASIENSDRLLRPGMLLSIKLVQSSDKSLVVPEEALVPIQDQQFVFIVDDELIVRKTEVVTGRRLRGLTEVMSGLQSGDRVVTRGTMRVRDGMVVRLSETEESNLRPKLENSARGQP